MDYDEIWPPFTCRECGFNFPMPLRDEEDLCLYCAEILEQDEEGY